MRLAGASLLLAQFDAQGEDVGRTIMAEISNIVDAIDPALVRELAERVHHTINAKIRQIRLRMSWERYA